MNWLENEWLDLLRECGGYYECPKDADGKRLGPLVAYTGRGKFGRQYVGDVYTNFAMIERNPQALTTVASSLKTQVMRTTKEVDGVSFCGAPEGGKSLALLMADKMRQSYFYPEKKVLEAETKNSREKSDLLFGRHEPKDGERVVVVEDVCNNFSTTEKLVTLIEDHGAVVMAIVCFLNGSINVEDSFSVLGKGIPVISLVRKPIMEYEQDHEEVKDDVARGNVVWSPKLEWARLDHAMLLA